MNRKRIASAVVAAGLLAATVSAPAGASAGTGQNCVTFDSPEEVGVAVNFIGGFPPGQKTGDAYTYFDEVHDADGTIFAKTVGYASVLYERPSDGHPMALYAETFILPDGSSFRTEAVLDRKAIGQAVEVTLPAIGTSGVFAGKKGFRKWQLLPEIPGGVVRSHQVLCG
jgi:hypothetical protein